MAYSIETRTNNPASQLRDELDLLERQIVNIQPGDGEDFLLRLDRTQELFNDLTELGVDLRPEEGRWQGILSRLSSKPNPIVRAVGSRQFSKLREKHPPAQGQWWYLDQFVMQRTRKAITRFVITLAAIIGSIALLLWGVNTFFPPDPTTVAIVEISSNVDQYVMEQDWESALAELDEAVTRIPDEPELLMRKSVIETQVGNDEDAADTLAKAEALVADKPALFWSQMGTFYLQVADLENAKLAGANALEYNPDEAQAYFLLAGVAEVEGDSNQAIDFFEKTFELAEADNPQLAVIAKVRMGQLLQSVNPFSTSAPSDEVGD